MSGEILIGGIMVALSIIFFGAAVCAGIEIPTLVGFFAGMFVLAAGLGLVLFGMPLGAIALGVTP